MKSLSPALAAFVAMAVVMMALDAVWIGVVAQSMYQQGIGALMAPQPRLGAAILFYAVYCLGLAVFVVAPHAAEPAWGKTLGRAALFGIVAYATFDLTALATLKDWPVGLSFIDMAWGAVISTAACSVGRAVWRRL
jgi:uncharacterized membrane protein